MDRELEESITEQQRNNRRRRATGPKLRYLLEQFAQNPRPDKDKQFEIGRAIDMTRRSVQIWFQNHRAKHRNETKVKNRNIDFGSYRHHNTYAHSRSPYHYRFRECQPSWSANNLYRTDSYPNYDELEQDSDAYSLGCDSITLGEWHRTRSSLENTASELVVKCDTRQKKMLYDISFGGAFFRIEYPLENIVQASLYYDPHDHARGHIAVEICDPPTFWRRQAYTSAWKECADFTKGEALAVREHWLNGVIDDISRDLEFIQSMRCQHHEFVKDSYEPTIHQDREAEDEDITSWLLGIAPPARSSLDRSQSSRMAMPSAAVDIPPRSEARMSRQVSMPHLAQDDDVSEFEEPQSALSQTWHNHATDFVPGFLNDDFKLSLPKSKQKDLSSTFSDDSRLPPPLAPVDLDLLLPLSLQSSRTDSPMPSKHERVDSPDIFADPNILSSSFPRAPLVDQYMDRASNFDLGNFPTEVSLGDDQHFGQY